MISIRQGVILGTIFLAAAAPAFADDCKPVIDSMIATAKTPYKLTLTRTGKDGKAETSHMVATPNAKYVETGGRWVTQPVSSQELLDRLNAMLKTAKMACRALGTENVNGQSATIYTMHVENQGTVSDDKVWVSADHLPLKSEIAVGDMKFLSIYDYADVVPPPDAAPLGLPPAQK